MSRRISLTLTDEQYARLLDESRRSGLGIAELVRRALDRRYGKASNEKLRQALDASFGVWADREFDGESYAEGMRRGLARRLTRE